MRNNKDDTISILKCLFERKGVHKCFRGYVVSSIELYILGEPEIVTCIAILSFRPKRTSVPSTLRKISVQHFACEHLNAFCHAR